MSHVYKILMSVSIIGGAAITAGLLPATLGVVAVGIGTAAGLWHAAPGTPKA